MHMWRRTTPFSIRTAHATCVQYPHHMVLWVDVLHHNMQPRAYVCECHHRQAYGVCVPTIDVTLWRQEKLPTVCVSHEGHACNSGCPST